MMKVDMIKEQSLTYIDEEHSSLLLRGLNELRLKGILCDVELRVGESRVSAHKAVLSACSKYFKAMFAGKMEESQKYGIQLHQLDEITFKQIIEFAYTGIIHITQTNAQELLSMANMLYLDSIVDACCEFLESQLHSSNCLGFLSFSEVHSCKRLWDSALSYAEENFCELRAHEEFIGCTPKILSCLLRSDRLKVSSEADVVYALEQWVSFDPEERIPCLSEMLASIRLIHLSSQFLLEYSTEGALSRWNHNFELALQSALRLKFDSSRLNEKTLCSHPCERRAPNRIMIIGGKNSLLSMVNYCEVYNPENDEWNRLSHVKHARSESAAGVLNDKLYIIGGMISVDVVEGGREMTVNFCGGTVETYDIASDNWTYSSRLIHARSGHTAVVLEGKLYVIGGYDGTSCLQSVECFDECNQEWQLVAPMKYGRSCFAAVALEGYLYVLGGYDGSHLCTVERYDPRADSWEMMPAMSTTRINFGACALYGFIFVVGGHDGVSHLRSVERFDPSSSEWTVVAPLGFSRTGISLAVLLNEIYAIGGHDGSRYLKTVEKYDPLRNRWVTVTDMKHARCNMAAATMWL